VNAVAAHAWHSTTGVANPIVHSLCSEALAMLEPDQHDLRARVLATLAFSAAANEGEGLAADPIAAEAVELARKVDDPQLLWQTLYARSHTLWASADAERRLSIADEMVDLAPALDVVEPRNASLFFRGLIRLESGDVAGFDSDLADVESLAVAYPTYWLPTAVAALWRTMRMLLDGKFGEAEAQARTVLIRVPRSDRVFRTSYSAQIFAIHREQYRLNQLIPLVQATVDAMPTLPALRSGLALAYAEIGEMDLAREHLACLAANDFAALRADSTWSIQLADIAEAVAVTVTVELAEDVYRMLAPRRGQLIVASPGSFCAGAADRYLGSMTALMGRYDEAVHHYEEALELESSVGSDALVARTNYWFARMLLERGALGDAERGVELLAQTIATGRRLGMLALVRQADSWPR
jgi:tetratricopeptide (TPR) repeat protein